MSPQQKSVALATTLLEQGRQFLLFFLPMLLILFVAASIHFYSDYEVRRNATQKSERLTIEMAEKVVISDISRIVSDLLFLAKHMSHHLFSDEFASSKKREAISELFETFALNKRSYGQLRYIDHLGIEQIRTNYYNHQVEQVPERALQNKAERYYVQKGLKLRSGEVYLSPMDLNIEEGMIEVPYNPVIRFVTPIESPDGKLQGIIVLNYLGSQLIDDFRHAVAPISERVHLLNSDGYWLSHTHPEREWGFMFDNESLFQNEYSRAWEQMQESPRGQFINKKGLFSYDTINPLEIAQVWGGLAPHMVNPADKERYRWHIVAHLPTIELESTPLGFLKQNRPLYIATFLFMLTLSLILTRNSLRRKEFELHHANELRFRDTLEEIHLIALTITPSGTILFCNNYLRQLLRKRRDDVIGKNWFQHFVPEGEQDDASQHSLEDSRNNQPGSSHYESHLIDYHGEQRLISWTSTTALNEEGIVESITYIGQDITEQYQTREALTKLARAAEQSPAVIIITDTHGAIEYANPKFTELTGYSLQEVLGKNPRILKSGSTSQQEYLELWNTICSGKEWRGTLHNRKKNGELYWESALISPIRNEEGKITHFLSVKEDITARVELEKEIKIRQKELDHARTLAAVGRMAGMVAHDLRNPLSSVKMGLQILSKKKGGAPEEMELCQIGLEQIRYMESIMEGLLAYSKPDKLSLSWSNLDKQIEAAVNAMQNEISTHKIEMTTEYSPGLPTLEIDKVKIRRVLNNLLSNAVHAIEEAQPENPEISIMVSSDLSERGSFIRIDLCDNGIGINSEQQDSLFEPFVTQRSKGTGLGLAIVKRIIQQHNGTIDLTPNRDQGTCVSISLPTHHASHTPSPLSELENSTQESFIQTGT